jgi:hypothetical protein
MLNHPTAYKPSPAIRSLMIDKAIEGLADADWHFTSEQSTFVE